MRGHVVEWQKWRFHVGFTPVEGLVLNLLEYKDRGQYRSVCYRASVVEMVREILLVLIRLLPNT